ncbi:hypothetical protein IU448_23105 [Nocardia flavorosea]|uniref:hypothetical protein n=1 Tax=Nocardia flavorosea TaxID=53429 RepID=UPI00189350B8|nr:hypothetical protein [Nocardia flavorosea]MBF6351881.1 hypothetical protein [Nocardia flavorosea]
MSPARSTEQLVLRCYWLVCLAGTIAAVSVTAANNAPPAVAALLPCGMVVMLTYPWLSHLEPDRLARRHILWLTAALLLSGIVWFPVWWGVGFVAVPALVAVLAGYAVWVRAAVRQARQPFEVRDYLEPGEEP